jgi:hypothetical protein
MGKKGGSQEKNEGKGTGDRVADGKVSNTPSQLMDLKSDGVLINLPPQQRQLIQQALSGQLPPEYAEMILQYYVNISRGQPATLPSAAPQK